MRVRLEWVGTSLMAHQADLKLLTITGIAHRCTQETELFFRRQRYDPRYCHELFRRAIVSRDQRAWDLIYAQYRPLVTAWVQRHSAFPASGEEVQYFVNRAFEKMWNALTPEKFANFADLGSVLKYCQMCTHSAILDQVRKTELATVDLEDEGGVTGQVAKAMADEPDALDHVHRQELWQEITTRLKNEKECKVLYGSFVLGLKPRELYHHFSRTFRDVQEVYRVKENLLARLRRDPEILELIRGDA
jgi:hypothetical protein